LINGKAIRGMGGSIDGKEENGGAPFPGRSGKSSNSKQLQIFVAFSVFNSM